MIRKLLLCFFALVQLLCANLNVDYTVSVGGKELPGTFSGAQLDRCRAVSAAAVEEIARGNSAPAEYVKRINITLRSTTGDNRALSDALIIDAPGISRGCAVYANGAYAGTVSDPEILENSLHNYYICVQTGSLELKPVYSYFGGKCNAVVAAAASKKLT